MMKSFISLIPSSDKVPASKIEVSEANNKINENLLFVLTSLIGLCLLRMSNELIQIFIRNPENNHPNMEVEQSNVLPYQQIREKIMQGSMDVNTRYPGAEDPSVLQLAIKKQDTELIDYLLKNNADVNIVSESCESALNLAIRANNSELVKKIILLVADLNFKSYDYGEDYDK
ncbi:hypothetical protein KQX54_006079 [Cotesia glomerata]|uniref:Ankyrin repeat domain-containing protein n=1 Tax=Cotesia glomerata TaxID=32391 RepID=A0AAV7IFB1_COTGL|nr:hypothetical protein KQX54_006079 [Cotesia glomerata]